VKGAQFGCFFICSYFLNLSGFRSTKFLKKTNNQEINLTGFNLGFSTFIPSFEKPLLCVNLTIKPKPFRPLNSRSNFFLPLFLVLFVSCQQQNKENSSAQKTEHPILAQLKVEIVDSAALALIAPDAKFEVLAEGFKWSEGPLWVEELQAVLFSDVPANTIYQWSEKDGLSVYLHSAGHSGEENKDSGQGPNGLILDHENRLVICQHGDRRLAIMNSELNNPKAQFISIAAA
jgi:hypothetical protein